MLEENSQRICILFCNFFAANNTGIDARLDEIKKIDVDRFQYRFQPIKFVNLAVPSPCETEPYDMILNSNRRLK